MHMPQIQCLLEIFDLETAHYIQYRPPQPPFEEEILDIVEVKRDRDWFQSIFPKLEAFVQELYDILDGKREPPGTLASLGLEDEGRRKALKRRFRTRPSPPPVQMEKGDLLWDDASGETEGKRRRS